MAGKPSDPASPTVGVNRREAMGGAVALGAVAGMAGCAGADQAPPAVGTADRRIGLTFDQSVPAPLAQPKPPDGSPNIVVIVLDDVGFSDLGCYGGEIPTPSIDALAAGGLRYANFRTTGVCSATRASLFTGLNPHSAGIGWLTFDDAGYPGYRGDLSPAAVTLAETLTAHGYAAYHCGKWHVNGAASVSSAGPVDNWPLQRGYARSYWFQGHSTDFFRPSAIYSGNERVDIDRPDYYATDDFTDRAIAFLRDHLAQKREVPFFLSLAHPAAHSPLQARREDMQVFRGRYDRGWDDIRAARLARQVELCLVPAGTKLPHNPGVPDWAGLSDAQRQIQARYMEAYAAVIRRLDWNIGRLVEALAQEGVLDNTLIVLFSDNGGSPDGGLRGTPNLLSNTSGGIPQAATLPLLDEIGGPDTYSMYSLGWATASNTPFRLYKHDTHLGGVADPLILSWPRGIDARGEIRQQYAHVVDLFPTLLECAGRAPTLATRHGQPAKQVQGVSIRTTFAAAAAPECRRQQHFEMNGLRAYYADGWRLVSKAKFGQAGDGWELFDLRTDCNETNDLAALHPGRVRELERQWMAAAHRHDVFPIDTRPMALKSFSRFLRGGGASRWVLRPPVDLIPEDAAPPLLGRSYAMEIELAPLRPTDEGVLVAFGNQFLGMVLFLRAGRIVLEHAVRPFATQVTAAIPAGTQVIQLTQTLSARPWAGTIEIAADHRLLVSERLLHLPFGMPMQGLQIGSNRAVPVSRDYRTPFAFTGTLREVRIEVDVSPYTPEEIARILQPPARPS